MELHIRLEGRKGLADQLYQQLRGIDSGHLAAGTQLPPTRLLAEQLGVSRKTVAEAYSRLTYDNLLSGVVGRGTFITPRQPVHRRRRGHPPGRCRRLERWRLRATVLGRRALDAPSRYDFIGGASSKAQFDQWRSCLQYALRRSQRHTERQFSPQGLPELRKPSPTTSHSPGACTAAPPMCWCAMVPSRPWT
jgi:GntR family transcriptional regulator/MocR family aminotransferase